MRGSRRISAGLAALVALAATGCGPEEAPVAAAPPDCLESWNTEETSQRFGRHVYDVHGTSRAEVATLEAVVPNPNVPAGGACAVIFAVPEWDLEYGTLGLVETKLGWASMQELARDDQAALDRIQSDAAAVTNAIVLPDGKIEED